VRVIKYLRLRFESFPGHQSARSSSSHAAHRRTSFEASEACFFQAFSRTRRGAPGRATLRVLRLMVGPDVGRSGIIPSQARACRSKARAFNAVKRLPGFSRPAGQ
jgi:hypothetical protein